jgi:tetratricopeptide (TPR) repeat protein
MTGDIFISHSSKDRKTAETVCADLEARGFSCWLSSRNVAPGTNFAESIVAAISSAKLMLFIFSTNSNNSDEVKKEIVLAGQHKVTVIPLRVEDIVPNSALAYEFATRQWVDLFDDWEQSIEQLVAQILTIIPPASGISSEGGDRDHAPAVRRRRRPPTSAKPAAVERPEAEANPHQLRADAYAKIGKYDLAIAEYDQAIRDDPNLAGAFHNRGNAHHANGANDLAIIDFNEAIRLRPEYPSAFNNRGNAWLDEGQYARAVRDFDEAIRQRPDFALAFNNRGFAHFREGFNDRAIADFTAAINLKPDLAIALENRAKAYDAMGRADLARQDRAPAAQFSRAGPTPVTPPPGGPFNPTGPRSNSAALIIGCCVGFVVLLILIIMIAAAADKKSGSTSDSAASDAASDASAAAAAADSSASSAPADSSQTPDEAWNTCSGANPTVAACSTVIAANTRPAADLSTAFNNRGNAYYDQKDYNRAIEDYSRAIDIGSDEVTYHNRGNAYIARNSVGDYDRGMRDFAEAIRLRPNYAKAYYDRGLARQGAGDAYNGAQDIAYAKSLDPKLGQ